MELVKIHICGAVFADDGAPAMLRLNKASLDLGRLLGRVQTFEKKERFLLIAVCVHGPLVRLLATVAKDDAAVWREPRLETPSLRLNPGE